MGKLICIGVLTSGGDSPGMNAAIRAVVRAGRYHGLDVQGITSGYDGLIKGKFRRLMSRDVSGIIQKGGTILKTARSEEFRTPEGRKKAFSKLVKAKIDALVVIGGDGSFKGANIFGKEYEFPVIGIPGTIDNDLFGTDYTIGYDTALNTVVQAIDKIRDTASSHNRLFFVEVMGRDAGFIALRGGIATGAEAILIPEVKTNLEQLKSYLEKDHKRKKSSNIIIVSEGDDAGGAYEIANKVRKDLTNYDIRVTVLGHIQRGGSPSAFDRVMASKLGVAAVEALLEGRKNIMVGYMNREVVYIPFSKTIKYHRHLDNSLLKIADILTI